jgi:ATP-dependent helicase/nuclease subunit A
VKLTREQSDAVERRGQDVCVVAGPGSGKTRVLVERFRRRVERGASPLRLLAITFTEKAANELKQRLAHDFSERKEVREQIERAPVYTIDAFCAHLLRENAIEAGIDPQFDVLDALEAAAELESAAEEALDGLLQEKPAEVRGLLSALDLSNPVKALIDVYQAMRVTALDVREGAIHRKLAGADAFPNLLARLRGIASERPRDWTHSQKQALSRIQEWCVRVLALERSPVSPEHFRVLGSFDCNLNKLRKNNPVYEAVKEVKRELAPAARQALIAEYYAPQRALLFEAIDRLNGAYRRRKQALNALDFADLEELVIRLLRDKEPLRNRVRERFDEILMDELQDTNPLQAMLVELIRKPDCFFAVGDINQSIYGFRHADPDVFRKFRDGIRAQGRPIDELRQNHRSRGEILFAAERILDGADGMEPQELEPARPFAAKEEPSVEVIAALADASDKAAELEARLIARRMRELEGSLMLEDRDGVRRAAGLGDMAVLVRNINALPPLEKALRDFGIPYLIGRGKHFYEAREVTDLVHLLRVIRNPRDEISVAAVLRSPLAGLQNETLFRLKQIGNLGAALNWLDHVNTAALDPAELERLRVFRDRLRQLRAEADETPPDRLLLKAIDGTGYESTLSPHSRANLRKLLARLREWHDARPRPLGRLVRELEALRESDPDEPAAPPEDSASSVRLMTIHSAKGLEFPVVFLAALHKGVSNDSPPMTFSPAAGVVARWLDPSSGESLKDLPYTVYFEERKRKSREEENRLFYVAMTRAEEHLVLSMAVSGSKPKNWAEKARAGLGIDLSVADNEPAIITPAGVRRAFGVRVLRADRADGGTSGFAQRSARAGVEEALPLPAIADQHDSTASVTSVALFAACPRRYYLGRYLGWQATPRAQISRAREVADEPVDASELGRQVHDLLAEIPVLNASDQARELASRFQMSDLARRASTAARVERESEFLLAIDDCILQGRIDLWFEEGGRYVLVDYKTDDVDAEGAAERARDYALQLHLYALALERITGRAPAQALLYFLRPDATVSVAVGPEQLAAARETVRAFQRAQSDLRFPPKPDAHCRRCPFYRGLCPAV